MPETSNLISALTELDVPLGNIYLDPNNPRFLTSNWTIVPEDQIRDEQIQAETRKRLISDFAIDKLQMNMEVNGYLPIDRVVVRNIGNDSYVVLEGNRRICAAKLVSRLSRDGSELPQDIMGSFDTIPCLLYTGTDEDAAWVFQGLRHITGMKDWSAFNKAKLLVEQMERNSLNLTEVGKRFGLTSHGAGQWVRGYYAYLQAKEESDYVSEVDERSYPYFQELFNRSSANLRNWMEWDGGEYKFINDLNFNEFVGWLYPRVDADENDSLSGDVPLGKFEDRLVKRVFDLRDISYLIRNDKDIFEQFREKGDLKFAYTQALTRRQQEEMKKNEDAVASAFSVIQECVSALEDLPLRAVKDPGLKQQLDALLEKLENGIISVRE
jgi:hypothetical protein